jgi:hypothetical protein
MWTPSPYAKLFAEFGQKYMKGASVAAAHVRDSEVLVSGLQPNELAILLPKDETIAQPLGIRAAGDGTAWIVARAGEYRLVHSGGALAIRVHPQSLPAKPGYDYVERVTAKKR